MTAIQTILESAVRLSIPLVLVALGEWVANRAGTVNLSIEGMMLAGAYGAAAGSDMFGFGEAGLPVGVAAGMSVALIQAEMSHRLSANQFVVGVTLNILVLGLTTFLFVTFNTDAGHVATWSVPVLSDIPVVGQAFFGLRWPAYLAYGLVPAIAWLVYRSRWGLEIRAVGENARAANLTGIDVNRRRRQSVLVAGALAGLGGAVFSVGVVGAFQQNMTAGRGFIALSAVVFGGWTVRGTVAGCFLFGGADALRLALPALDVQVNTQMLIAAPYVLALVAMLFFAHRFKAPRDIGVSFQRGRA